MARIVNYPHREHRDTEHRMVDVGKVGHPILVCSCICPLCIGPEGDCICPDCRGHWPTGGTPVAVEAA